VAIERREGYWYWTGGPVPPGSAAITLGRLVIVRHREQSERLLRHELTHVRQYSAMGMIRFLIKYLGHYLHWRLRGYSHSGAYRRIPQEIEAYWLERVDADEAAEESDPASH